VIIDEPVVAYYGGTVAGPVFRRVGEAALRHLGVPAQGGGEALDRFAREQRRRRRANERALRQARREGRAEAEEPTPAIARTVPPGSVEVPDLSGETARAALVAAHDAGLAVHLEGTGLVVSQDPPAGEIAERGARLRVILREEHADLATLGAPRLAATEEDPGAEGGT